jgi:predicted dehydrogenase
MRALSEPLKIAFVGLRFGDHVIENQILKGKGSRWFSLAGVTDIKAALSESRAAHYGVKSYPSYAALLADPQVDVVGIFTPPTGRAEMIRQAINSGKHVITTKPFELRAGAALDVLLEAEKLGRVVHMNSPSPLLSPDWQCVQDWRNRYTLGRPIAAHFTTWASYRESADGGWYDDPVRCPAAPIFRIGVYGVNDMVRLLGPAESVQVITSRLFTDRPTPDNAEMSIRFKNGCIGGVFASFCVNDGNSYADAVVVNFENGTVYLNAAPPETAYSQIQLQLVIRDGDGPRTVEHATVPIGERAGTYQWDVLYRAIHGERPADLITPAQIAQAIAVVEAMTEAERTGKRVSVRNPHQPATAAAHCSDASCR